jgi:hypothetical protein
LETRTVTIRSTATATLNEQVAERFQSPNRQDDVGAVDMRLFGESIQPWPCGVRLAVVVVEDQAKTRDIAPAQPAVLCRGEERAEALHSV